MSRLKNITTILLPGIALLLFWQWITHGDTQRLFFFSAPGAIARMLFSEIQTYALWRDVFYTGFASISGLVLGTVFGSALGIGLWVSPRFSFVTKPYIALLGAIPVFALAPMMILWFGIGLWSKIVMAAFAVFLVAAAQAHDGAVQTARHHLSFAQSLGASPLRIIRHIILPGAMQWVLAGVRLNIGFALVATFIAEFISSEYGLGHYILKAGGLYDMPRVFTGILLIAALSALMQQVLKLWRPQQDSNLRPTA